MSSTAGVKLARQSVHHIRLVSFYEFVGIKHLTEQWGFICVDDTLHVKALFSILRKYMIPKLVNHHCFPHILMWPSLLLALNWKELCFKDGSLILYVYKYIYKYIISYVYFYIWQILKIPVRFLLQNCPAFIHTLSESMISFLIKCELQFILSNLYRPHFLTSCPLQFTFLSIKWNIFIAPEGMRFLQVSINVFETIIM